MNVSLNWSEFKNQIVSREIPIQYIESSEYYYLCAFDGNFEIDTTISTVDNDDKTDFETNFKAAANVSPSAQVTTQYEKNDKDLKLARGKCSVDPETRTAEIAIKVPGTFGSGQGRYVLGGYGFTSDYNIDDVATVRVEDKDRNIAWAIALSMNPDATEPLSDETVKALGAIPGIGAFPDYPVVKSYTDDELDADNQGWYFYPVYIGNDICVGEVEVNPIGGYAFLPAGFYLVVTYQRPEGITTGTIRVDIDWGKKP